MTDTKTQPALEKHLSPDFVDRLSDTGRSLGIVMTPSRLSSSGEIPLSEVLIARVRAGEPIHISGPLDGPVGQAHLATISKLRTETGLPVRVIFS